MSTANGDFPQFERTIGDAFARLAGVRDDDVVWLAVSGGRDSVAMARVLAACASDVRVVHVDHGLRPSSSADAEFVAGLAAELSLPCANLKADLPAGASEDAARRGRYDAIARHITEHGSGVVAVAHTADDQVETILHRVIRGTGVAGLAGIPATRTIGDGVRLVRPMLDVTRDEVTAYLTGIGQAWCDDSTNETDAFTRNRIRNELLPTIRDSFNAQVAESLIRLGDSAREHAALVDAIASERMGVVDLSRAGEIVIPMAAFANAEPLVIAECFRWLWRQRPLPERRMKREHWLMLVDLVTTNRSNRRVELPGDVVATRNKTNVTIELGNEL